MKALVLESSNTMRSTLLRILSARGFEVAEADNSTQASEVLRSMGEANLVLVDWSLPESDSLEFINQLRQGTVFNTTVVMLAVAEPGIRELRRALEAGADDYLTKPFTSQQLDAKLAQAGFVWQL
ncbi:MAG: response regulator [Terracidiphilus sp.]|jgi:two-component system chemotaxis response regulator CheY